MTKKSMLKIFGSFGVIISVVAAGLGYSTWALYDKVRELESNQIPINSPQASLLPPLLNNDNQPDQLWKHFNAMPKDLSSIDQWMDDMMSNAFSGNSLQKQQGLYQPGLAFSTQSPKIKFEETNDEYSVIIEMPEGEDIEVNTKLSDGRLSVSGRVSSTSSDRGGSSSGQFQFSSEFSRTFTLDDPVDQAAMEVINEKGKTIVTLPKTFG